MLNTINTVQHWSELHISNAVECSLQQKFEQKQPKIMRVMVHAYANIYEHWERYTIQYWNKPKKSPREKGRLSVNIVIVLFITYLWKTGDTLTRENIAQNTKPEAIWC